MLIPQNELSKFLTATHSHPHQWLGMHAATRGKSNGLVVRAFLRDAAACEVIETATGRSWNMKQVSPDGFFEVFITRRTEVFGYMLKVRQVNGEYRQFFDPYCFLPTLGDQDLYLFNEGNEHRLYTKLGAHPRQLGEARGVAFAVWAPNADRVSVVGNFNQWDGRYHPMRPLGASGVWELFIPGLAQGELYKYEIRDRRGNLLMKTDPFGTYFEAPPNNASIVYAAEQFTWGDAGWLADRERASGNPDRPVSIYEVHLGSWRRKLEDANRPMTYRELAPVLTEYVLEMGFTHVEVLPVSEHPFGGSWGYQVTGFFAPTHRYGSPADFAFFVDHLHRNGVGIIVDWVPAHFPRDSFALAEFDGTHLFEHADPRQGAHQDWGTLIFNYGRNEVRCFLVASALAWFERYHIDGLRVDAVASMLYLDYSRKDGEWIPNKFGGRENLEAIEFLKQTNDLVHKYYPGALMVAEESTAFAGVTKPTSQGGLGFDFKWNMGWMHDNLRYFSKDPIHRKWHHNDLTFGALYQFSENFITALSHDEVVHGKASLLLKMGAWHIPDKAANLRALFGHMWAWPGKKLLFMGGEFGQSAEWNYAGSLDWHLLQYLDHQGIRQLVRDLNRLYREEPLLGSHDLDSRGFRWINGNDGDRSVISYLRTDASESGFLAVVGNYTPVAREGYRVGVPRLGFWRELINTNSQYYGGSGLGNEGGRMAQEVPSDGMPYSVVITLPPTSTTVFKWAPGS